MENILNELKFDEKGLIPVVTQDCRTDEVLMLAYANKEALEKTIETGKVHYWSRSRKQLWLKGETSGHFQHVKSISLDCDGDTLLIKVEQKGAACHTGHHSCFYRKMDGEILMETVNPNEEKTIKLFSAIDDAPLQDTEDLSKVLEEVYQVVLDRKIHPKEGSYTNYLFEKGMDKILKKVGEETAEVIIATKNLDKKEITGEIADLFYHIFVLLVDREIKLDDILIELKGRR